MKSYSNRVGANFVWIRESLIFFSQLRQSNYKVESHSKCIEYESILREYSPKRLSDSNVLEIGFGAKPLQLACLSEHAKKCIGIDVDFPLLPGRRNMKRFKILFSNGVKRFLRSNIRFIFFDKRIYQANGVFEIVSSEKFQKNLYQHTFGSSAKWPFGLSEIDFIYSEDVFEHIPPELIRSGMNDLASQVSGDCLVYIRPNIFTGITGGHDPEFYSPDTANIGETKWKPWEHLYPESKFETSTYLNRLRFRDYVELFSINFEIIKVFFSTEKLGYQFDITEVLQFCDVTQEELFYNQVGFLLKKRKNS